ncbi:MAG: hypothetical protein JJU12_06015 [Chlamydiales bacterium]|nr:hypothetical protein [Chlamydiales bacterium]
MGVSSVQAGQGPESIRPTESQEERQKLFELQWEINLIGTFVAVSQKNGNVEHQLNSIKKSFEKGEKPEKLVPAVNQLIDEINKGTPSNVALFPPFDLSSGGNENKAMTQYALSLEKYLNVAAEQGKIGWEQQMPLFDQTSTLVENIGAIPADEAMRRLNAIIEAANRALPPAFQLQALRNK